MIANPAVFECARSAEDEWLVLASDGLWDTVNSAQCATFIKQETKKKPDMNADELANALVKRALRFRTQDNVAVVVVDLRCESRVAERVARALSFSRRIKAYVNTKRRWCVRS